MEPPYSYEMRLQVRDYEVDCQGIVNNANYLHYLELTRHRFCEDAGWSFAAMHAAGVDPVVRRVEIDYLSSLTLSQWMVSKLWLERRGARFLFHQDIYREADARLVARAVVTIVSTVDGRLSRGDELARGFKDFITGND